MDPQKESTLRLLRSCEPHWVRDAPVRRDRLTRPQRTSLSCGLITERENEIERWAAHARKFIPPLATKASRWLPALYPLNLPLPQRPIAHSAIMLRAEFPVHKNSTWYSRSAMSELRVFTPPWTRHS